MTIKNTYPTVKPTIGANFFRTKKIPPSINYSRLSTGTYVDEDGLIKTAGIGVPRFDYDSLTGVCKGLLIEESRINYARPSEPTAASAANSFLGNNSGYNVWYRYDSTVTSQNRLGINGLNVIPNSTIDFNGYTGGGRKEWAGLAGGFNASTSTGPGSIFSFYINPNNWNGPIYCGLLPTGNTTFITRTSNSLIFNNGVYVGSSRWTVHNIFNDGTYRISKTILDSNYNDGTYIVQGGSAFCTFTDIVGDESSSWWVGGVQYEISQPTASSYIPTTSSAVTRAADTLTVPTGNLINKEKSSILIQTNSNFNNTPAFSLNDGTAFNESKVLVYPTAGGAKLSTNGNIVTDGLVLNLDAGNPASYPGSGTTWTDLSGNSNDGTLVNGVGYNGSNGGSLVFDGVNDYVDGVPIEPLYFTLSCWFIATGVPSTNDNFGGVLIASSTQAFGNSLQYIIGYSWLNESIVVNTQSNNTSFNTGNNSVLKNRWYNVVCIYDGSSRKIFINGDLAVQQSYTTNPVYPTSGNRNYQIGRFGFSGYERYFNGNIAQVSIYNRALTTEEIQQNFNSTRGRFGI